MSEVINEIKGRFGWANVIVRHIGFHPLAAIGAFELIVSGVNPSQAYFGLQTPMTIEHPGIAVGQTGASEPSLKTVVSEHSEVCAKKFKIKRQVAEIILATDEVCPKEVS